MKRYPRYYYLQPNSVEIFFTDYTSLFLSFQNNKLRNDFCLELCKHTDKNVLGMWNIDSFMTEV